MTITAATREVAALAITAPTDGTYIVRIVRDLDNQ